MFCPCSHRQVCSCCSCVCVCVCGVHGAWVDVCFWLMFVMTASFVGRTCCRAWGRAEEEEDGGESRRGKPSPPSHGPGSLSTRVPGRRALRPPIAATSRRRLGAPPGPAGWTPDPSPRDYVHASLGFMGAARGAREGLGGTSGFSEGVRFSPGLLSEL